MEINVIDCVRKVAAPAKTNHSKKAEKYGLGIGLVCGFAKNSIDVYANSFKFSKFNFKSALITGLIAVPLAIIDGLITSKIFKSIVEYSESQNSIQQPNTLETVLNYQPKIDKQV